MNRKSLAGFVAALACLVQASVALAAVDCPEHPQNEWIPADTFQKHLVELGYKLKAFRVEGNCYLMLGSDRSGQKVEVYFDTKTGDIIKSISH